MTSLPGLIALEDGRALCSECGTPFLKVGRALTCGPACSAARKDRQATLKRRPHRSSIPSSWRCPVCQKPPMPRRRFCSDACYQTFTARVTDRLCGTLEGLT